MIHRIVIVIGNTHLDCYHGNKDPPHNTTKISIFALPSNIASVCQLLWQIGKKQKLQVLPNFPQKYGYHGNHVSTHSKNNRRLCFTILDLHAKFKDDRRRNAAGRALTRKSLRRRRRTRRDEAKSIVSSELCSGDTIIYAPLS